METPTSSLTPPAAPQAPTRGITDTIQLAWDDFTKNPLVLLALILVPILVQMVITIPVTFLQVYMQSQNEANLGLGLVGFGLSILISLFQIAFNFFWMVVQFRTTYRIAKGESMPMSDMLSVTQFLLPALAAYLIQMLAISVGILMCIIPGLILILLLSFTNFYIVSRNMGAVEALQASFQTVKDNAGSVFLTFVLMFALNVAGILCCIVGVLVSAPVTLMMFAHLFVDITEGNPNPAPATV